MLFSFIIPTHNRQEELALTLAAIGRLDPRKLEDCEVIVVDNASRNTPTPPTSLPNGIPVRTVVRLQNEAAAGRNAGAHAARGQWLIMLDDDSNPIDERFVDELHAAPPDVAAIGADITLPDGSRERGGLPEVFIGCAVAIRRDTFLHLSGYDRSFVYYAEEYDLAARIIRSGQRIIHSRAFRAEHRKVDTGRDFNHIIKHLVRNNAWVAQRYTPDAHLAEAIIEVLARYSQIAEHENAVDGYRAGRDELIQSLPAQPRSPLPQPLYDRFTGLAHARAHLARQLRALNIRSVALVDQGKNAWAIRSAIEDAGVNIVPSTNNPEALLIATLSPGPMLDAWERRTRCDSPERCELPVITPWTWADSVAADHSWAAA